jgi:hypothetical protein
MESKRIEAVISLPLLMGVGLNEFKCTIGMIHLSVRSLETSHGANVLIRSEV